jgi:preprotein translocase subunit SecG
MSIGNVEGREVGSTTERLRRNAALLVLIALFVLIAIVIAVLAARVNPSALFDAAKWFDPMFFQYNVLLLLVFIFMVPTITLVYVDTMRRERVVRLRGELSAAQWRDHEAHVNDSIGIQFGLRSYIGSTLTLTVIIALGLSVTLLLKPVPGPGHGPGVDYGKGANLLLLGPYIEAAATPDEGARARVYHRIIVSLTAFQFGFLGAYVFFIGHILRGYFTLDLSPNTFISISGRMVVSSLIALVVSFPLQEIDAFQGRTSEYFVAFLPMVSFFIGFFPTTGFLVIEKLSSKVLGITLEPYPSTSLAKLSGMSLEHEVRLGREGYDNVENLAEADPVGLAVRTGFSYRQLRDWIGEAWLRVHLRQDYDVLVVASGIVTREQLHGFLTVKPGQEEARDPYALLAVTVTPELMNKVRIVAGLLGERAPARS